MQGMCFGMWNEMSHCFRERLLIYVDAKCMVFDYNSSPEVFMSMIRQTF